MMTSRKLLNYYKECYRLDGSDLNLWQLTRLKTTDRCFFAGNDEIGNGFLPRQPIEQLFAEPMQSRVQMYQRERVLLYASLFVVGKFEVFGEARTIVSPLIYCQADIECDNNEYYAVLSDKPKINEALIKLLLPETFQLPEHLLDNPCDGALWHSVLKHSQVELDISGLMAYPSMTEPGKLKNAQRRKIASVHSFSMLAFVERSTTNRGVLHEMQSLIEAPSLSPPLHQLLTGEATPGKRTEVRGHCLPGLLSNVQHQVLDIAANQALGLVTGPPGTGKSYTIAAIAAEHMSRGESVLVVTHSETALDVIQDKLLEQFKLENVTIRAGQKAFLKQFKAFLADLLSGAGKPTNQSNLKPLGKKLAQANKTVNKLESRFNTFCHRAVQRGLRLQKWQENQNTWLERMYLMVAEGRIAALTQHWHALDKLNRLLEEKELLASQYLQAAKDEGLAQLLRSNRKSLKTFNQAVRARTSQRQLALFETIDFNALLKAFPIWLASLNSLHRVLPLKQALFDLVIIDEASQSNITSALPALYRAKRALVVGDAKQLRHYSFLSKQTEARQVAKQQLQGDESALASYRDNSILDLVNDQLTAQNQLAFLDEHFRCKPELIHFSNRHFYGGHLRIMQKRPCSAQGHLHIHRVKGIRDNKGINNIEAEALFALLDKHMEKDRQTGVCQSIGILSPYRHQAEYLAETLFKRYPIETINQHRMKVATPFGFQGEERDIMLLSFCVDDNSKRASVYLNKEDMFNVAITRAKHQQHLFLSMDESRLSHEHMLRRYIQTISQYTNELNQTIEQDPFQKALVLKLETLGIQTWCGFELGGLEIDVLCRHHDHYLAVDLIGYPGQWQDAFSLTDYKILKRMGIEVLPITWGLWSINATACIDKIKQMLNCQAK